ncbi:MAG TPA: hypothetical protein VMX54_21435 [Vicinamibacteria bacterium]|nr:hypothetical protein [Vicinamibacteria bacterium]
MKKTRTARAAHQPQEPAARDRLAWLLSFLQRDTDALRPGDWLNAVSEAAVYLGWQMSWPNFEEAARGLQRELRQGLEALAADGRWDVRPPLARTLTHLQQQPDGTARLVYARLDPPEALRSAAVELVAQWYPQLRRCRHCQAWFLPRHGRQQYHDATCAAQDRWSRFAPRRKRDYHLEYRRRVKRAAPGANPQRRPGRQARKAGVR